MDFSTLTSVTGITVICYLLGLTVKALGRHTRLIPTLCGLLGGLLGIAGLYLMPDFPAGDLISAAAVGVASGLAATGFNEAVSQLR